MSLEDWVDDVRYPIIPRLHPSWYRLNDFQSFLNAFSANQENSHNRNYNHYQRF